MKRWSERRREGGEEGAETTETKFKMSINVLELISSSSLFSFSFSFTEFSVLSF